MPKLTIPSPNMIYARGGASRDRRDRLPGPRRSSGAISLAAYVEELRRLGELGCTYLQFDDTSLAMINDPDMRGGSRSAATTPSTCT